MIVEESGTIAAAPAPPRRPSGIWSSVFVVVLTLLLLYPLSVGPAAGFYRNNPNAPGLSAAVVFYAPLETVAQQGMLGDMLMSYIEWWVEVFK